jgi:hypothetical protein
MKYKRILILISVISFSVFFLSDSSIVYELNAQEKKSAVKSVDIKKGKNRPANNSKEEGKETTANIDSSLLGNFYKFTSLTGLYLSAGIGNQIPHADNLIKDLYSSFCLEWQQAKYTAVFFDFSTGEYMTTGQDVEAGKYIIDMKYGNSMGVISFSLGPCFYYDFIENKLNVGADIFLNYQMLSGPGITFGPAFGFGFGLGAWQQISRIWKFLSVWNIY